MSKTNHKLILRIHDSCDNEAWAEFVTIYEPMIQRVAIKLGMSRETAADATQDVLVKLVQVVQQWTPNSNEGSFRSWLNQVARNLMIRMLQKRSLQIQGSGRSDVLRLLADQPARECEESRYFDLEFRRHVFAYALKKIEPEFQPSTWQSFWMSTVDGLSVTRVAEISGCSVGSIYISRSRVMKRIKAEVKRLVDNQWESFTGFVEESNPGVHK